MWTRILAVLVVLAIGQGTALAGSNPDKVPEKHDNKIDDRIAEVNRAIAQGEKADLDLAEAIVTAVLPRDQPETDSSAVVEPRVTVFPLDNVGATLQQGEPTDGGLMTRTVWGSFKAPDAARIVIHTFGSKVDTVLAAYRGAKLSSATRVAANDNFPVPGMGATGSLVQFNTVAGADYAVQVGARAKAQGDITLNVFKFPATGGLAALLVQYGGTPFNGRDYSCDVYNVGTINCPAAKFIVYNATDKTLSVTPSTTLGTGVTSIGPFVLAARKLKVVEFRFGQNIDRTPGTQVGDFVFTGRVGAAVVAKATTRAIIVMRPTATVQDMIRAQVVPPTIQTGYINAPFTFTAKLTNTSAETAIGCHFRSVAGSYVKTSFYEINPANGSRLGADDAPKDIAAGHARTFKVVIASQTARDGDHIDPDVIADCANNARRVSPLRGGFDISTSGYYPRLSSLNLTSVVPANDVLNVPKSGFAYFTFRATNTQPSEMLDVLPAYVGPFNDPANSSYSVSICRTSLATGACLSSYASSVTYNATKGTVARFSVRVKAPTGAPPFDPDQRRVYVNFKETDLPYIHIAAPSIAVRKQ